MQWLKCSGVGVLVTLRVCGFACVWVVQGNGREVRGGGGGEGGGVGGGGGGGVWGGGRN